MEGARVSMTLVVFQNQIFCLASVMLNTVFLLNFQLIQNDDQGESQDLGPNENDQTHSRLHPHGEHEISYFDPGVHRGQQHSVPVIPEGATMGGQPLPMKSADTGSPPPNSAATSMSTSTPTSLGGVSSSGDGQMKGSDHGTEYLRDDLGTSPNAQLQGGTNPGPVDPNWSMALGEINQRYSNPPSGQTEGSFPQSPGGQYNPGAYPSAIKILVSNNVAGSIIGRAGQTISELQSQSSARIKLSQTGDYYPGTQDRVCLVQGQLENVKVAVRLLLERLYMLQEQQHSQHLAWQPKPDDGSAPGFDFAVRLLVPSSSCGMIIGKAGSNIKHMEEASGVSSVRLSPKESVDPSSPSAAVVSGTSERVVTLTGPTMGSCLKCLCIVLDGMMSNQEICRYSNMTTSYSRIVVPDSFNPGPPTGQHVRVVPPGRNPEPSMWDAPGPYPPTQYMGKSNSSPDLVVQMLWDQRGGQRMPPHEPPAPLMARHLPPEPTAPYNYGFIESSPSFDMPPLMHPPGRGTPTSTNPPPVYLLPTPSPTPLEPSSIPNSVSAPDLIADQLQDSLRISASPSAAPVEYPPFVPLIPQPTPPGFTVQVLVPDTLIGSILGRGGRTLNELQMHSNCRIRISQRGEYVPGTRNRIVTIRGPTSQSVSIAQYLMSQRMVLPPTATYSPQPPPQYHTPQVQPRHVQHPLSHPHHQLLRQDVQHHQYHGPPDTVFQSSDSQGQHHPSRSNPNKDLPHT
jgi:RNA-binding protein Nova